MSITSHDQRGVIPLPHETPDVAKAAILAADELLGGAFDEYMLVRLAADLNKLCTSYSTHDLAASVALNVLKNVSPPNRRDALARMTLLEWFREGKVTPALVEAFESPRFSGDKRSSP
jgi:hypothetical protein